VLARVPEAKNCPINSIIGKIRQPTVILTAPKSRKPKWTAGTPGNRNSKMKYFLKLFSG